MEWFFKEYSICSPIWEFYENEWMAKEECLFHSILSAFLLNMDRTIHSVH